MPVNKWEILSSFKPVQLSEVDGAGLLNRVDTKFILAEEMLDGLLTTLVEHYRVLEVEGLRQSHYQTQYFDTPDLSFYHDHHRGRTRRLKVRFRTYAANGETYFEVKQKDSKGRTRKKRLEVSSMASELSEPHQVFLKETIGGSPILTSTLESGFERITLVDVLGEERVTIDTHLSFNDRMAFSGQNKHLAIIEIKQNRLNRTTPIMHVLRGMHIHPYKVSKYCLGMATTRPRLKQNLLKEKFLKINKTLN